MNNFLKINKNTPLVSGLQELGKVPIFFRFGLTEQMLFVKRLSLLLKAGVPILMALQMLKKQTTNPSSVLLIADLTQGVEQGQFLHTKLQKYHKYIGEFVVNVVKIGELSGTLHENLNYLAEELRKKKNLRRKIISALLYPAFIVVATLGITIVLISYVFPKILPVLQTFKGQLPFTTRSLIYISKLFTQWGWLIALVLVATVIGISLLLKRNLTVKLLCHKLSLRIPILGKLLVYYHIANLCRTLGLLMKSDVRIVEAVKITAKTATNLAYRKNLEQMNEAVFAGGKISEFFEKDVKLFPPLVSQMVSVGENTGRLSESLLYLSDIYEQEVDELTKNFSTAIEPVLMVFMGLLVGFIAMSIITPIYSLTQGLTR